MRNSARCKMSTDTEDICQEVRVALWEIRDTPATLEEARLIFVRQVNRFELRAKRQVSRQGILVEAPEELAESIERDTVRLLALFDALEKLDDHERWLVKECKIDGRTHADVAQQLGLTEDTIRNRIWRAMARLLAIFEGEKSDGKGEKRGAVIAPLLFEFTDKERAVFSAIWNAEGRVPAFGGGPPNSPPPPPPVVPPVVPVAPVVSAAVGSAVSAVTIAIVLVLLVFFPAGIVAIYYFWDPPIAQTANKGLRVPSVNVVEDVVPIYPLPVIVEPTAKTSNSDRMKIPKAPNTPSSSAPIDPEEMERARRQAPRSLPARKK